ncbi:MAG: hypothetical protein M3Q36_00680 [bacterium]|nr:hypothetical protein [bacterium]
MEQRIHLTPLFHLQATSDFPARRFASRRINGYDLSQERQPGQASTYLSVRKSGVR